MESNFLGPNGEKRRIGRDRILDVLTIESMSFSELREKTSFSKPVLSNHLKRLVKDGLVVWLPNANDRRGKIYSLTDLALEQIQFNLFAGSIPLNLHMRFNRIYSLGRYFLNKEEVQDFARLLGASVLYAVGKLKEIETKDWENIKKSSGTDAEKEERQQAAAVRHKIIWENFVEFSIGKLIWGALAKTPPTTIYEGLGMVGDMDARKWFDEIWTLHGDREVLLRNRALALEWTEKTKGMTQKQLMDFAKSFSPSRRIPKK